MRWKTDRPLLKPLAFAVIAAVAATAHAQEEEAPAKVSFKGEVALETRVFQGDGIALTQDRGMDAFGRIEVQRKHGAFEEKLRAFGRADFFDANRNLAAIEEAFIQWRSGRTRVRFGADIVNWSATEAFHPADIINARNLDSDIENFDKLGEPMLAIQFGPSESTTIQAILMPMYMKSVFPSPNSRLNFASPGVDLQDRAKLFDRNGNFTDNRYGMQWALRLQQTIGSAEFSVHYVDHMDRLQAMPAFNLSDGGAALVFQSEKQVGVTYQQAFESGVIAKFEASYGRFSYPGDPAAAAAAAGIAFQGEPFPNRDHATYAGGLEYTLEHGWASSTFILEGQSVAGVPQELWPAVNLFPRNILLGYRLAWSSADSRELRVAVIVNTAQTEQRFLNLAYEQRLWEQYTLKAGLRLFAGRDVPNPIGFDALARGDHVFLNLVRHF